MLAGLVAATLGCRGPEGGTIPPSTTPPPAEEVDVSWSTLVPSVPTLTYPAPAGAATAVEVALDDGDGPVRVVPGAPAGVDEIAAVTVLGLKAGRTYRFTALADGGGVGDGVLEVPPAPPEIPALVVDVSAAGSALAQGYVLVGTTTALGGADAIGGVAIYDGDGDPVWWVPHAVGEVTVTPSIGATPGTVWWDRYDMADPAVPATAVQAWLDGSDRRELPLLDGHHAVLEVEPGVVAWIARDVRPNPQGDGYVTADRLLEAPVDAIGTPRTVTALYDAVFAGAAEAPCWHAEVPTTVGAFSPLFEWTHLNSLVWEPVRGRYLVHARWLDAVYAVDRATGAVAWQLGGPDGDFALDGGGSPYPSLEGSLLSHAHLSDAWDGGLVAFDNGSHRVPPRSALVALTWDEDARTVAEVDRWEEPSGRFVGILGDVRRLPDGGTLSSWSTLGELGERDASGVVVWHARTEPLRSVSRAVFLPTLGAP